MYTEYIDFVSACDGLMGRRLSLYLDFRIGFLLLCFGNKTKCNFWPNGMSVRDFNVCGHI